MKLEVQELRAGYGAKLVLDGVGLTVPEGSIVTLPTAAVNPPCSR